MILQAGDSVYEIITIAECKIMLHRGIVLPDNTVLHFSEKGAVVDTMDTFLKRRIKLAMHRYTISDDMYIDVEQIRKLRNETKGKFRLLTNNCEHFVNWFLNEYTDAKRKQISQQVCALYGIIAYKIVKNIV